MSALDTVYQKSPVWLQNLGISAFGLLWRRRRFGPAFRQALPGFRARETFTAEQWCSHQTAELRRLLLWCHAEVPHYRRTWSALGLEAGDLAKFELGDLGRLPITEKENIRRAPADFFASSAVPVHKYNTSGSTGTPLTIGLSSKTQQIWAAGYEARCRHWAGVDRSMGRAMIGGRSVVPASASRPPFWRYNSAEKQLYFSAFHISPANARYYAAALNRYKPDYLVGYASAHSFLASLIEQEGLTVHQPKAVLTSSDKLTTDMRATLTRVYGCKVFDAYSGVECCCLASECEHGTFHVSPDLGVVELVNDRGALVGPGEVGHIIATGLVNLDQPLIRYRMGDLASWSSQACRCGRVMPAFAELFGRQEEAVVLRDGRRSASFYKVFQGIAGIREAQIIQHDYEVFQLKLVTDGRFDEEQKRALLANIDNRYGKLQVQLDLVDRIERTRMGKLRLVISKVNAGAASGRISSE